jgi:hypothetical protein
MEKCSKPYFKRPFQNRAGLENQLDAKKIDFCAICNISAILDSFPKRRDSILFLF